MGESYQPGRMPGKAWNGVTASWPWAPGGLTACFLRRAVARGHEGPMEVQFRGDFTETGKLEGFGQAAGRAEFAGLLDLPVVAGGREGHHRYAAQAGPVLDCPQQ